MANLLSGASVQATSMRRHKRKHVIVGVSLPVFLLLFAILMPGGIAAAHGSPHHPLNSSETNPYSPAYQHTYRHGVVPTIPQLSKIKSYQRVHPRASGNTLSYGGGIDGIGVTSGTEKVYLVFWGSQWGTQSTDSSGNLTFSNDSPGGAPHMQNLFKGLGTGNELWSGTMTQYCDGLNVSAGATTCSSSDAHVGYPNGGALAGVWYDNSGSEPGIATQNQLANEAINAATHFGNITAESNRDAQFVILSAPGTNPDNYQTSNFCAWHSNSSSPYGDIAFTNLPYILDAGFNCGQNFVNSGSAGALDGYTIIEGHEYAETVTDQNPAGGWINRSSGEENGDECAWIRPGRPGGTGNVTMGNDTYAMQTTWSNDTNACDLAHPIVTNGPATNDFSLNTTPTSLSITTGGSSTSAIGTVVTGDPAMTISLSASVSPAGPTISLAPTSVMAGHASTLTVSAGSLVTPGTYNVTVTGMEGSVTHHISISVIVTSASRGITNGGFERGNFTGWHATGAVSMSSTAHSGRRSGKVGASSPTHSDSNIRQTFTVPGRTGTLSFWYRMSCLDTVRYDWAMAVLKDNSTGRTSTILPKTCHTSARWTRVSVRVTAGHSYTLTLVSHDDNFAGDPTYTLFDDVTLNA